MDTIAPNIDDEEPVYTFSSKLRSFEILNQELENISLESGQRVLRAMRKRTDELEVPHTNSWILPTPILLPNGPIEEITDPYPNEFGMFPEDGSAYPTADFVRFAGGVFPTSILIKGRDFAGNTFVGQLDVRRLCASADWTDRNSRTLLSDAYSDNGADMDQVMQRSAYFNTSYDFISEVFTRNVRAAPGPGLTSLSHPESYRLGIFFEDPFSSPEETQIISPFSPGVGVNRYVQPAIINQTPSFADPNNALYKQIIRVGDPGLTQALSIIDYADTSPIVRSDDIQLVNTAIIGGKIECEIATPKNIPPGIHSFYYSTNGTYIPGGFEDEFPVGMSDLLGPLPIGTYGNRFGGRWLHSMSLKPDIVATGSRTRLTITAAFCDADIQVKDFNKNGDYVRLLLNGEDFTLSPAQSAITVDPVIRRGRIAIVGQRLIAGVLGEEDLHQNLELDLEIGADVAVGIYDVDIKFGTVKAYSDELSQLTAGANGSHRMKKALNVVKLAFQSTPSVDVKNLPSVVR